MANGIKTKDADPALTAAAGYAPPRRRVEAEIKIGADSFNDLLSALDEVIADIGLGQMDSISGGCSSGYHFKVTEDETVTHDSYFEAVKKFKHLRSHTTEHNHAIETENKL